MACVYAHEIAQEIRQHPMFDKNDDTRFIAGYIFEMIMGDRDVSEDVWVQVLSLLYEQQQPVNLLYDLPEECQHLIYKHIFLTECLTPLMEEGYDLRTGPIHDYAVERGYYRWARGGRRVLDTRRPADRFYNRSTADIRLEDYILGTNGDNLCETWFPTDTEGQSPLYWRLVKKYC